MTKLTEDNVIELDFQIGNIAELQNYSFRQSKYANLIAALVERIPKLQSHEFIKFPPKSGMSSKERSALQYGITQGLGKAGIEYRCRYSGSLGLFYIQKKKPNKIEPIKLSSNRHVSQKGLSTLTRLLELTAQVCNVDAAQMQGRYHTEALINARRVFMVCARGHISRNDITHFLGRAPSAMSYAFKSRGASSPELQKLKEMADAAGIFKQEAQ